ncbi:hypothetical protein [Endozoicomonas sp. ALC066]|uniref:hypothetical protein n=1 Tax=Endozoicomonas sp. ALC066 TaxID=3403078 RepID=UPI003BB4BBEE
MTKAHPNTLSLALTFAISSSIIAPQALADRKLQTKSVDIINNGHVKFTHSEVMVRPTLDQDQQPIPKSYTTTYRDKTDYRAIYAFPSKGFTEVLADVDGCVSSVDLFETGENGVAQKYTKVLKVGNEAAFRFTHNLKEKNLVIEVRSGMTDQYSVEAVRYQLVNSELEPLTKIASPGQLANLLKAVNYVAGNLGANHHYVPLATLQVEEVEVNGRTFMRLLAAGDQPPDRQRLGQSLFVNDDVLLAAAASAYIQVHVLEEDLQQKALNELLAHSKPVGYVVNVEDDTQVYPVPAGYPKLEVTEATGEVIVFHGQRLNPHDIAFVENLYDLWKKAEVNPPSPGVVTKVKKYKVKSYQYVIRSMQMTVLERFVARHGATANKEQPKTLADEDQRMIHALTYYESLQQALASATPYGIYGNDEFELTLEHIRVVLTAITPTWLQIQLTKHFSFRPQLRDLLTKQRFVQSMLNLITGVSEPLTDIFRDDPFVSKVLSDMARQLIERELMLEDHLATEAELARVVSLLRLVSEEVTISEREKQRAIYLHRQLENKLLHFHAEQEELENLLRKLQHEVRRIPHLERHARDVRAEANKAYKAQLAEKLGIDNWDDTRPAKEQARLISIKLDEINQVMAATEQFDEEAAKVKLAAMEGPLDIIPINENDLSARFQSIQHCMQQNAAATNVEARHKLAIVESQLGLVRFSEARPEARHQAILKHLNQQGTLFRQHLQKTSTEAGKRAAMKAHYAAIAVHLNIKDFDSNADIAVQQKRLVRRIQSLNTELGKINRLNLRQADLPDRLDNQDNSPDEHQEYIFQSIRALPAQRGIEDIDAKLIGDYVTDFYDPMEEGSTIEQRNTQIEATRNRLFSLADLETELEDIRTPGHPIAMPEVLRKLTDLENALAMNIQGSEDDVYYRRDAIAREIRSYIEQVRQQVEEEALDVLETLEEILKIDAIDDDDNQERLGRILTRLEDEDITEKMLDDIDSPYWKGDISPAYEQRETRPGRLQRCLNFFFEDAYERAIRQQTSMLKTIEDKLNIDISENSAAQKRGQVFTVKLAKDLDIAFDMDVNLSDRKDTLRTKIQELIAKSNALYDDEAARRVWNNEIAFRLNIEDYKDDATLEDQNSLIETKLQRLDEEVVNVGLPDVNERIAAIDHELDRQMARLGAKPRFVLDRDAARARRALKEAESELTNVHRKLNRLRGKRVVFAGSRAELQPIPDEDNTIVNQAMKKLQTDLGLTANDAQVPEERMEDVKHYLREYSEEKRDEILEQLKTLTNANILTDGDDLSLLAEADYSAVVADNKHTGSLDNNDELYEALGELPLTRDKYAQILQFLRIHDRESMKVSNARLDERNTQQRLDLKKEELNTDESAETLHKNEIALLNLALEQKSKALSKAEEDLIDFHKAFLDPLEKAVGLKPDPTDTSEHRVNALRSKLVQLGGHDGSGGKIRQLTQEQVRLEDEIEARKADIERIKEVLKAAEKTVENDGSPFQYSPKQAKVLNSIHRFSQQHPLKKQALEAAIGLTKAAKENGKATPSLATFDFDNEFAPVRLQALAGDKLTFIQASRIVEVFRSLKTTFPESSPEPEEGQPLNAFEEVRILTHQALSEIENGAQEYDDEIRGLGLAGIHYVERDLKDFSEYLSVHSASGNKIIALLREGLISKIELENHIKAVRGVEGYQTVNEFEHFLGYKHGVNLPRFRAIFQVLSGEGVDEFMQSAFTPVTVTASDPAGIKESVAGMKDYAAAVIANYVLDDIAFENGHKMAAFLSKVQDTLTPYAHAVGLAESDLVKAIDSTLMQAHAAAVEHQLNDYWVKPSAFLVQAVTWYFSSYTPLLATHTTWQAVELSLSNVSFLYLLDLTNRGDYLHRMLTPFQHWLEGYGIDLNRTSQYANHIGIERVSEVGGLAMPLGKAASSVILLRTGSMLFARQYNANPHMYHSILRLVPEIVKSMASGQGVQVTLLHRVTPQKVKTLTSATAALALGPIATVGAYAQGLVSGFSYAQTFGFALASSLTYDFFMNDNKMLTQWLGGPLGRTLDKISRWAGLGETDDEYVKRASVATPQRFNETDAEYAGRVEASDMMHGWTRHENYLQFRERRDRTTKLFENGWEKYFRENVPKWSFSHAESIPYSYTLSAFCDWR